MSMPNAHDEASITSATVTASIDRTGVSLRAFMTNEITRSERQQNVEQDRVWRLAAVGIVELFQTLARKQDRGRGIEHDVLREQRPVLYRRRNVRAQVAIDIALIAENRQHGGCLLYT